MSKETTKPRYFRTLQEAVNFYQKQGIGPIEVGDKIWRGEIVIGPKPK